MGNRLSSLHKRFTRRSSAAKMPAPVVVRSVPFDTHLADHAGGFKGILARDRARAKHLLAGHQPHGPLAIHEARRRRRHHGHPHKPAGGGGAGTVPAEPTGSGDGGSVDVTDSSVTYTMSVGVGSPATQYTLLIDTGSSNTWIGAQTKYTPTSTSKPTGNSVSVSYGSGNFTGSEYTDTVALGAGSDLVIANQSLAVAASATGFSGIDGILGIGPVDLTAGTVAGTPAVPTVTDNLFAQGTIAQDMLGISYAPTTGAAVANGAIDFGGADTGKCTGAIAYAPVTGAAPASNYWGVDQSVAYGSGGGAVEILGKTSGIVDTGTTLLLLATSAFEAYTKATGGVEDSATGLLVVTEEQFQKLESLFFTIGETTYELTANAQIWPRSLNSTLGGDSSKIYLIAADLGSNIGAGLDFINGFVFLQRFYSVFDTANKQVGLATTQYTNATTN